MTYRLLLPAIFAFLCTLGLSAQTKFFLDVSGNYSLSQDFEQIHYRSFADPFMTNNFLLSEHYEPKPGIDFNVGVSKNIYKKLNLTGGIGISAIQFKRTFSVEIQYRNPDFTGFYGNQYTYGDFPSPEDPEVIIGDEPRPLFDRGYNWLPDNKDLDKVGQTEIMYVNIPLGIEYPVTGKLILSARVKDEILTYSRQVKQGVYSGNQRGVYSDKTSDGLSNNLLSGDIGLQYQLFKQLWLSTSYNHYFTPVYDESYRMAGDLKYKTFRLGLKYDL